MTCCVCKSGGKGGLFGFGHGDELWHVGCLHSAYQLERANSEDLAWLAEVWEALFWHMVKWNKIVSASTSEAHRFPGNEKIYGYGIFERRERWQNARYELGHELDAAQVAAGLERRAAQVWE